MPPLFAAAIKVKVRGVLLWDFRIIHAALNFPDNPCLLIVYLPLPVVKYRPIFLKALRMGVKIV
jgi:hypothetical protein